MKVALPEGKMRVFNHAKFISEWIEDRRHFDSIPNVLDRFFYLGANTNKVFQCFLDVINAPINLGAIPAAFGRIWVKAKLKASHIETNIKRLVKIRAIPERFRVPFFCFFQTRRWITNRAKSKKVFFHMRVMYGCEWLGVG